VFGIRGRGLLKSGYAADLMLFDPARAGRGPKRRVRDLPAGGARLVTAAIGVHGVWVNGERAVDGEGPRADGALAGKVLREFDA